MELENLIRSKGVFEIIRTIGDKKTVWGDIQKANKGKISRRTLSVRLRELKEFNFVDVEITYVRGRPAQLYFLTKKGKKLLEVIKSIEELNQKR